MMRKRGPDGVVDGFEDVDDNNDGQMKLNQSHLKGLQKAVAMTFDSTPSTVFPM